NNIKVTVIVMNDGYLGMVTQWQNMFYGKRVSATKIGLVPDFVRMAEILGCQGSVVNKSGELSEAIQAAKKSDVPYVIDVHVDPEEELAPFIIPGTSYRESYLGKRCRWRFP
ncbi:MAG: thiamine pyrophosphate-dependent enzyme, partial [Candidatus Thermoplasmatota archaeon]|nr:thiamine pyrophosphate-dependent enzyme [Candidatus Thermoplasmatota archaeon]